MEVQYVDGTVNRFNTECIKGSLLLCSGIGLCLNVF